MGESIAVVNTRVYQDFLAIAWLFLLVGWSHRELGYRGRTCLCRWSIEVSERKVIVNL